MPDNNDRRQPLGGISKETYVHHGGNDITYELIRGLKSDLCHEIKLIQADTAVIKSNCACREKACKKKYVTRTQVYIATGIICAFLVGLGIISWHEIGKILEVFS